MNVAVPMRWSVYQKLCESDLNQMQQRNVRTITGAHSVLSNKKDTNYETHPLNT